MKKTLACAAFLLCSVAHAQQCGTYNGPLLKDGFGPPDVSFVEEPAVPLPPANTPLALSITAPSEGAVLGTRTIQVYGTYAGPPATGVAINRSAAVQTASEFIGLVVLKPGSNVITVKVTKLTGETETQTRTVTYDAQQAPNADLQIEIQGEHAPIKPKFTVTPKAGLTVTQLQIDFDGDSTIDLNTPTVPANLRFEYRTPGFFTATATLTLDDGDPMTPPVNEIINRKFAVLPLPLTRAILCHVFYRMKDRLAANDIPDAVKSVNAELRSEVQQDFEALPSTTLGAERLGTVVDGTIGIKIATLTLAVTFRSQPTHASVSFERSIDGVWRITDM
ncbi:MAG: hypothetical protein IPO66_13580 [Rhodanobacteraceae bacterium]|nr:hypothetical protein [Rhodanobacteraceae bacterium]